MILSTHSTPGLVFRNHRFELPLDYANPGTKIGVFAREVCAAGKDRQDLPTMVFFQGGPGSGSPRPTGNAGWIKRVLQEYRLLLLDQRGTGLSTPISAQTLRRFAGAEAQAAYFTHFRSDNIVRDAEAIRGQLIGDEPWSVLGQSYGGFCVMRYLSASPEGLREALITGGIPSLTRTAEDVYRGTYPRVLEKNRLYFERYPDDADRVRAIVRLLLEHDVQMPGGGRLSARRFQQLGLQFGMSDGFDAIHYLLEEAFVDGASGTEINWNFLFHLEQLQSFDTNPIFSVLQEACYAQGAATRWAAARVHRDYPEFEPDPGRPVLFTGEMIYPWMFDEYTQLRPLKQAAGIIADHDAWPALYDVPRLMQNRVPVAAAVYYDDMYVHRQYSEETAKIVPNMRLWVTNQYEHNGLRADGEAVVDRLLQMARGDA
jgi:pimeloyl-ACP methyl ester carboxylesterase